MYHFYLDCRTFHISNIIDIHNYVMKKHDTKIIFVLIKKMFIGLLTSLVSAFSHTKCVSLNNQKCMTQPTFIQMNSVKNYITIHFWLI